MSLMFCIFFLDDVENLYFINFVNPISGDRHIFTSNCLVFTRDFMGF